MSEQPSPETRACVIAARVAGMSYVQLSARYGKSVAWCRYACRCAMRRGDVTADQIRHIPLPKKPRYSKEEYDRLWVKRVHKSIVIDERGCWLWQGGVHGRFGYGQTGYRKSTKRVHRKMYEIVNGVTLTAKQYVCHSCDVPRCCNPEHLFVGDQFANMGDSVVKGRHAEQLVTHCPKGHEYNESNTYIVRKANGKTSRDCRVCARAKNRIKAGWPEAEAYTLPVQPLGYLINPNRRQA